MVNNTETQKPIQKHTGNSIWHLLGGIVMIVLGVYIIFNPGISLVALALYIGIAIFAVGVGYIIAAFTYISGWYVFAGVLNILIGFVLMGNLGITAASLPIVFAIWAMAVGAIQLANSYQLSELGFEWRWALAYGIIGIVFGFLILLYPVVGAITLTTTIGIYVILYGILALSEYSCCRISA